MNPLIKSKITNSRAAGQLCHAARVGVALSGGADSVALLAVAREMGWCPVALHCNFRLRGEESQRDQDFVEELCQRLAIPLYKKECDVATRRQATGESVEMACRSLRYEWFEEMARKENLEAVLLGHHRDDNIETFMLNALRGSGTGGLKGIPETRGIFMRPLLALSRREIMEILDEQGLGHVEDHTNTLNDFNRNKLRNIILPAIDKEFPQARQQLARTISLTGADHRLLMALVGDRRRVYTDAGGAIDLHKLIADESQAEILLYHIFGGIFNISQIGQIIHSCNESGRIFTAGNGLSYLLDRGKLSPVINHSAPAPVSLALDTLPCILDMEPYGCDIAATTLSPDEFAPVRDHYTAWFDLDALRALPTTAEFTAAYRGDRIAPYGMNGTQLVSDVYSDAKLSLERKQRQPVLRAGNAILWIPGLRNSSLCAVTSLTRTILQLQVVNLR